jgi:hypothetical protein
MPIIGIGIGIGMPIMLGIIMLGIIGIGMPIIPFIIGIIGIPPLVFGIAFIMFGGHILGGRMDPGKPPTGTSRAFLRRGGRPV